MEKNYKWNIIQLYANKLDNLENGQIPRQALITKLTQEKSRI